MTGSRASWQQLAQLLSGAGESVTLVAPYIKVAVLEDVLAIIPDSVASIHCVTRWSPGAVAAGVTDPEIIETLGRDPRATLRLCPTLHAKIYIADTACLVGSANLTRRGTETAGLNSNIEILVSVPADNVEVQRVLQEIEDDSVAASRAMADLVLRQAEMIRTRTTELDDTQARWYPVTRRPENLYNFYAGKRSFGAAVGDGMILDLVALDLPLGIAEKDFNEAINTRLCAIPELANIVQDGRGGTADLQRLLIDQGISPTRAKRSVQTLVVWLQHFSDFYTTPDSWELRRGREL